MRFVKTSLFIFFLALYPYLFCLPVDFDVVVVGSSPIPLLEALYYHHIGKRVLVLEESSVCGGAWKSINICGLFPVDLGCHTLGHDKQILNFFKDYVGCQIVSLDNPHLPFDAARSPNGFYFRKGCYEIIHNLLQLIEKTDIVILLDHKIESVWIDNTEPLAIIKTEDKQFSTSKILVTPYSHIQFENLSFSSATKKDKAKFHHLYMLIEDPTPVLFSFRTSIGKGISRLMNLTHFVGLEGSGTQLIVLQIYGSIDAQSEKAYLDILKKLDLVNPAAHILKTESYTYEQGNFQMPQNIKYADSILEILKTNHIQNMLQYIPKWTSVLNPFHQVIMNP